MTEHNSTPRDDRYITLAIHTYNRAQELRSILEGEGIDVMLQNVNLQDPQISAGVRVRIRETDLPFALRIVENPDIFKLEACVADLKGPREIMVPIDFSKYSMTACKYAFNIAYRHSTRILLLHSYVDPYLTNALQLSQSLSYDIADSEESHDIEEIARKRLAEFEAKLKSLIKQGEIPPVKFSSILTEGLPEDAICHTAKTRCPALIVMGTRGAGTKSRELVGSVTAEVLDNCRFTVYTVPENSRPFTDETTASVVMFVSLDQEDFLALDALQRFLPALPDIKISFVKLEKSASEAKHSVFASLLSYAEQHYPQCHFSVAVSDVESLLDEFASADSSKHPDLIVVPNKKKNVFARLFNPGIAHRILFHADIPMMVIPV